MKKGDIEDGLVYHAGFPNAAEDQRLGGLSLDKLAVKHRASTFFWRLEGDIVELQWRAGSIVVVDRSLNPSPGRFAVVVIDDDFTLCQVVREGFVTLGGGPMSSGATVWGVVTHVLQELP